MNQKRFVQISRPGQATRNVAVGEQSEYRSHDDIVHSRISLRWLIWILFITVAGVLVYWRMQTFNLYEDKLSQERELHTSLVKEYETKLNRLTNPTLRELTAAEMPQIFLRLGLGGVAKSEDKPTIYGNVAADTYIQQLAIDRGYQLWPIANSQLAEVDNIRLQLSAAKDWLGLKTTAAAENVKLGIRSAFRSVEEQRQLFISRLAIPSSQLDQIGSGKFDDKIIEVIKKTAPPGYSRHHTGYAVDLYDVTNAGAKFETTAAYTWLSANNFLKARQYGWIPSYPTTAEDQGPEPEPWEFVYVGITNLAN